MTRDWLHNLHLLLGTNFGNASILEVAWTAIGIVGFLFTVSMLHQCWLDLQALHRASNFVQKGARHIIARANLRGNIVSLILFVAIIWLGVVAMTTPPATRNAPPSAYALTLATVFIVVEISLMVGAVLSHEDRRSLIRVMRDRRVLPTQDEVDAEDRRLDAEAQRLQKRAERIDG